MTTEIKPITADEKISQLAMTFPSLRGAPGVEPWDALALLKWTRVASHGEAIAAKFVLGVWNPSTDWDKVAEDNGLLKDGGHVAPFDLFEAMNCLDHESIAAISAWIRKPFFP